MYFLYSLALSLLFILLLPYFLFQAFRQGKYFRSFIERLGKVPDAAKDLSKPVLWVHTVSVGEFNAARPLLARLKKSYPQYHLVVSTTTMTGQALARQSLPDQLDAVFYFPFDWKFSARRALDRINPVAVLILETELWPNFLRLCRRRKVATILVNGRISPRSFARYLRVRKLFARVIDDLSLLIMQSQGDAERVRALGADPSRVRVCGNLKYDLAITGRQPASGSLEAEVRAANPKTRHQELDQQFNLSASKQLIVAGSTAPGEEAILLAAFGEIRRRQGLEEARLLLAPRHPERFNEVAKLLDESRFTWARRSERMVAGVSSGRSPGETPAPSSPDSASRKAEVILLDSIGELIAAYEFASVVFVGGSLVARGGHNIIEPAAFAKPVIVGPHTENFRQIIADFAQAQAVVQIKAEGKDAAKEFTEALLRLLTESEAAEAMGKRAAQILLANRGATDCALAEIDKLLGKAGEKP